MRFEGGARGVMFASQVSVGEENGLAIRVYGERRGLRWRQETPNTLQLTSLDGPEETWSRGNGYVGKTSPAAARATRLPAGHPEAFFEAFASIYANACDTIRARILNEEPDPLALDFPTVDDGLRGMLFIEDGGRQRAVGGEVDPDAGGIGHDGTQPATSSSPTRTMSTRRKTSATSFWMES